MARTLEQILESENPQVVAGAKAKAEAEVARLRAEKLEYWMERCERLEEALVRAEKFRLAIRERLMWQDSAAATDDWQERYREGFDAKTPPFVLTPEPDEQVMQEGRA